MTNSGVPNLYARKLAFECGLIQMRDLLPGDRILIRRPGEFPLSARTVTHVERPGAIVNLEFDDGLTSAHDWKMSARLV